MFFTLVIAVMIFVSFGTNCFSDDTIVLELKSQDPKMEKLKEGHIFGDVLVNLTGKIGFITDEYFGLHEAHVVCTQLGFNYGAVAYTQQGSIHKPCG